MAIDLDAGPKPPASMPLVMAAYPLTLLVLAIDAGPKPPAKAQNMPLYKITQVCSALCTTLPPSPVRSAACYMWHARRDVCAVCAVCAACVRAPRACVRLCVCANVRTCERAPGVYRVCTACVPQGYTLLAWVLSCYLQAIALNGAQTGRNRMRPWLDSCACVVYGVKHIDLVPMIGADKDSLQIHYI